MEIKMPNIKIEFLNKEGTFDEIAKEFFNYWRIVTPSGNEYQFAEIEFYFYSEDHKDPFAYGIQDKSGIAKKKQMTNGQWFFHWSGIDITIGNKKDFGGILIRGIKKINGEYISGPLKVMMELLSSNIDGNNLSVTDKNGIKLYIVNKANPDINIFSSGRIGLNVKDKLNGELYINSHYRFLINKDDPKHKCKDKGNCEELTKKK